jgi:hypothetical protein
MGLPWLPAEVMMRNCTGLTGSNDLARFFHRRLNQSEGHNVNYPGGSAGSAVDRSFARVAL